MKAANWIDRAAEQLGGASDYAVAKRTGLTRSAISSYRRGRTLMDDDACIAIADVLGIDPLKVIADQAAERAKTERSRAYWRRIGGAAAVIVAVGMGGISPAPTRAYVPSQAVTDYTLCELDETQRGPFRGLRGVAVLMSFPATPPCQVVQIIALLDLGALHHITQRRDDFTRTKLKAFPARKLSSPRSKRHDGHVRRAVALIAA